MVKKNNTRITITLSKSMDNWISQQAEKKLITKSKFIAWLLSCKINDLAMYLKLDVNSYDELYEIVKTKWID